MENVFRTLYSVEADGPRLRVIHLVITESVTKPHLVVFVLTQTVSLIGQQDKIEEQVYLCFDENATAHVYNIDGLVHH